MSAAATKQEIRQDPHDPSHFSMIPHMAADTMNPYQLALYTHYKRVAGENGGVCHEGIRTTSKKTQMSIGKVNKTRDELASAGWIKVLIPENKHHPKTTVVIDLVPRWKENREYCESLKKDKRSSGEQQSDPTVHVVNTGVHVVNTSPDGSVHVVNKRININTKEETNPLTPITTTDLEGVEPTADKAALSCAGDAGDIQTKPVKAKKSKERKLTVEQAETRKKLFEIVCIGSFGKQWQNINGSKGFASKISQNIHLERPDITPDKLEAGYRYFSNEFPDVMKNPNKRLKDVDKILHYVGLAEENAKPTYGPPDPNCPDCNGRGWWIDKSDQYNHKSITCGCRTREGVTNG